GCGSENESDAPLKNTTRPSITSDEALKTTKKAFKGTPQSQTSELLVYPGRDGKYSLAYRVEMTNLQSNNPSKMNYFIDAKTGKILDQYNALPVVMRNAIQNSMQQTGAPNGNTGVVPPWLSNGSNPTATT